MSPEPNFGLTQLELNVLARVGAGYTNHEIEEHIGCSRQNVKLILVRIMDKLGVFHAGRAQIIRPVWLPNLRQHCGCSTGTELWKSFNAEKVCGNTGLTRVRPPSKNTEQNAQNRKYRHAENPVSPLN